MFNELITESCSAFLAIKDKNAYKVLKTIIDKNDLDEILIENSDLAISNAVKESEKTSDIIDIVTSMTTTLSEKVKDTLELEIKKKITGIEEFKDDITVSFNEELSTVTVNKNSVDNKMNVSYNLKPYYDIYQMQKVFDKISKELTTN